MRTYEADEVDAMIAKAIARDREQRPAREWVGLTDAEFQWIYDNGRTPAGMIEMAEAKLKEKNQ